MQILKTKTQFVLFVKTLTVREEEKQMFDYKLQISPQALLDWNKGIPNTSSGKININVFTFELNTRKIVLYRQKNSCNILAIPNDQTISQSSFHQKYRLLIEVQITNRMDVFELQIVRRNDQIDSDEKDVSMSNTSVSSRSSTMETYEQPYLVVGRRGTRQNNRRGYRIIPGQLIKLGKVVFSVTEVCVNGQKTFAPLRNRQFYQNGERLKCSNNINMQQQQVCKFCFYGSSLEPDNYLISPCKCSGTCGKVHIDCLVYWMRQKSQKHCTQGSIYYSFQKFKCEVCKSQLPVAVETQTGKIIELLPIQRPNEGNYFILECLNDKLKSLIVVKNSSEGEIKIGRSPCEADILIPDISVSRLHTLVTCKSTHFQIYDNNSKFGTLIKEPEMNFELQFQKFQHFQIGRTVLLIGITKNNDAKISQVRQSIMSSIFL